MATAMSRRRIARASSSERYYSVQIRKTDWRETFPPWRGLTIRRPDMLLRTFLKVVSVDEDGSDWILRAESKGAANG